MLRALAFALTVSVLASAASAAWLGVYSNPHTTKIEVDGQTFAQGIAITDVVADGPAAAAGLMSGDVVVAIDGAALDCPASELPERFGAIIRGHKSGDTIELTVFRDGVERQARIAETEVSDPIAWEDPDAFVRQREPGTALELVVTRVRRLHTLTVTLAAAPPNPLAARPLAANESIFAAPIAHLPEEALAEALIREFDIEGTYRDQRNRLAQIVEQGDPYRLSRFAYAMREPFAMVTLSRQLVDVPAQLTAMLVHSATWIDQPPDVTTAPALQTGLSPQEHAQQIESVLTEANVFYEKAFAALSDDDRNFIEAHFAELGDALCDDIMILRDPDRQRVQSVTRLVQLAAQVDTGMLAAAAVRLSLLLDDQYLEGLRKDLAGNGAGTFLEQDTAYGKIVFSGAGDSWFQSPAAVIVDLGGDDFYTQATQRPFAVVIDLGGDDAYQATFPYAIGCGFMGVSLLYDSAGSDSYIGRRWSIGSAALGVGVLIDRAGDDAYRGADFSQGAAFRGIGLLIDGGGNDRYEAPRFAQGVGLPGGFGAVLDRGDERDSYYCKGRDLGAYGTPGIFAGWGQGCGLGLRGLASGGIALLCDEGGDDVYEAGNFSQGGGYYFGWGCLVDRAGSDRYLGERYAQAFAAHQAMGYLEDYAGDDFYLARRGVGQSCSWDQTVTVLLDHAGDDTYSGGGFGLGASAHNGLAILVDYAGRDTYREHPGNVRAGGNDYHGGTCFSLLLDLGDDEDVYPGTGNNGVVRHGGEHGFFADLPGDATDALGKLPDLIQR